MANKLVIAINLQFLIVHIIGFGYFTSLNLLMRSLTVGLAWVSAGAAAGPATPLAGVS